MVGGTMLCGYMVSQGELTVGDFVLFIVRLLLRRAIATSAVEIGFSDPRPSPFA